MLDIFKALSVMMMDFRRETEPQAKAPRSFSDSEKLDDDNKLIVRAMIAFAAADGRVDLSERDRVLMQLGSLGLSDRDTRFIMHEFQAPADLDDILSKLHLAESRATLVKRIRAMTDLSNPDEVAFLNKVEGE